MKIDNQHVDSLWDQLDYFELDPPVITLVWHQIPVWQAIVVWVLWLGIWAYVLLMVVGLLAWYLPSLIGFERMVLVLLSILVLSEIRPKD